jgi:transitional endoplasmic reticulum ATPase
METVLNQILTEIDGLEELKDVVVMGATNQPTLVDPALLRAGRFDRLVYIGEPDLADRKKILSIHLRSTPVENSTLEELVDQTEGFDEKAFDDIFAKFGNNRQISVEEALAVVHQLQVQKEGKLNRGQRRKNLVDQMVRQNLTLIDEPRDKVVREVAEKTEGYVGADLEGLCREAGIFAMREKARYVTLRHFEQSLEKVHPTMNERLQEFYGRIRQHFKGGLPKEVQPPEYQ